MRALALVVLAACDRVLGLAAATPADAPDAAGLSCPSSYTPGPASGSFYRLGSGALHFSSANTGCQGDQTLPGALGHTHLVVIDSDTERAAITALVGGNAPAFIGLTDITNAMKVPPYHWITDENVPVAYWDVGEPDNQLTDGCVVIKSDGRLDTYDCDPGGAGFAYVCECDAFPQVRNF